MTAMVGPPISLPTDLQRFNLSTIQPGANWTTRSYGVKPPKTPHISYRLRGCDWALEQRQISGGHHHTSFPPLTSAKPEETGRQGTLEFPVQTGCSAGEEDEAESSCVLPIDTSGDRSDSSSATSPYLSPTASPCSSSPTLNSTSVPSSENSVILKIPCSKFRLGERYSAIRVVYAINNDRNRSQDTLSVHYPDPSDIQEGEQKEAENEAFKESSYETSAGSIKNGADNRMGQLLYHTVPVQDVGASAFQGNLFQPPNHNPQLRYRRKQTRRCRFPPLGSWFFILGFILMPFWWIGSIYLPRPKERAKGADYDWRKRNRIATVYGLIGAVFVVGIFSVTVTRKASSRLE